MKESIQEALGLTRLLIGPPSRGLARPSPVHTGCWCCGPSTTPTIDSVPKEKAWLKSGHPRPVHTRDAARGRPMWCMELGAAGAGSVCMLSVLHEK